MTRNHRVGLVVTASLLAGLVAAAALTLFAFPGADEHVITGTALLAFAFGWGLLAAGSSRWTDQPQRWAAVPAALMGLGGAALLIFAPGPYALQALGWVWPPALLALVVWMTLRARRQLRSRSRRWLLYPVFGLLALASLGGAIETAQHRRSTARCRREVVWSTSADTGSTSSASGRAALLSSWSRDSARRFRLGHDRAGRRAPDEGLQLRPGRSRPERAAPESSHRIQAASDLRTLLSRAGEPGPYVMVGHSLGGAYALDFAQQFPDQVAGLVLLDSMSPTSSRSWPGTRASTASSSSVRRTSVSRPPRHRPDRRLRRERRTRLPRRRRRDPRARLKQARALKTIGSKPLFVLTAGKGQQGGWAAAQDDLATLSSNSVHRILPGATHESLLADGTEPAVSRQAIRAVVRVRTRRGTAVGVLTHARGPLRLRGVASHTQPANQPHFGAAAVLPSVSSSTKSLRRGARNDRSEEPT